MNQKWVSDIFYIHTKRRRVVSIHVQDLVDNSIALRKIVIEQTANRVKDCDKVSNKERGKAITAKLRRHTDQDGQYTSQAYFKLNSILQHGTVNAKDGKSLRGHKIAMIQGEQPLIDGFIDFYNRKRIKKKRTGAAIAAPARIN